MSCSLAISFSDCQIELDPTNSRVYFNRGDIFRKKGDFDRAISEYTELIRTRTQRCRRL